MRTLATLSLLAPLALLFAACDSKCGCDKAKEPAQPTPVASAAKPDAPAQPTLPAPVAEEGARKPPVVSKAWRGSGATLELSVWEMHCMGCAGQIQDAFAGLPGVKSAEADYESSVVKVTLADAAQRDAVIARIPAALKALNEQSGKEFRVLGL